MNTTLKQFLLCLSMLLFGINIGIGAETSLKEKIELGESLFARNCAACHGEKAIGQNPKEPHGGMGKNGILQAPALNGKGHTWHHPDSGLFQKIKEGTILPGSPMKGWEGRMNDEEIWVVIRYFQFFWPEKLLKFQQKRSQIQAEFDKASSKLK